MLQFLMGSSGVSLGCTEGATILVGVSDFTFSIVSIEIVKEIAGLFNLRRGFCTPMRLCQEQPPITNAIFLIEQYLVGERIGVRSL